MLTTMWDTLEMSCWALASGGLEGIGIFKKVALDSETGHQFPPQCGHVVLACAQTTMRGVANIWAAAHSISVAVKIKAPNIFSTYFSIQSTSWVKSHAEG